MHLRGIFFAFISTWFLFASVSLAVDRDDPVFEGFLGASVFNSNFGAQRHTMPGFHFGLALNLKRNLRLTGEFAAHYRRTNLQSGLSPESVRLSEYQFLGGPEFVFRGQKRAVPFVHVLFGVAARHYYVSSGDLLVPRDVLAVDHGFASAFGGGVDVALSRRWALRAVQFDYLLTHLSHDLPELSPIEDQLPNLNAWQHNHRVSFGVVLRLGNRTK